MKYTIEKVCGYPAIDKAGTGKRIKKYMDNLGLSVKEVRDYLQLGSVQSIYHWLEGKSLPSMDNLFALSILLEVTVDDLICSKPLLAGKTLSASSYRCSLFGRSRIDDFTFQIAAIWTFHVCTPSGLNNLIVISL